MNINNPFLKLSIILIVCMFISLPILYKKRELIKRVYYLTFFTSGQFYDSNNSKVLNYRLFSPDVNDNSKLPLILYLHPWGHGGNDNKKQISQLAFTWANKEHQNQNPSFVLAPQCPINKEWANKGSMSPPFRHYTQDKNRETIEMKMIISLINQLVKTKPIDTNRIYVVGYSMGATGCWDILTRHPNLFAASIIASGVSDTSKAPVIKHIPLWVFSGAQDQIAPARLNENMVNCINKNSGNAKYTIFPDKGHSMSMVAFEYPGIREWLFAQGRNNSN